MPEITHVRPKTAREVALEDQLQQALTLLRSLQELGYTWPQLHSTVEDLIHRAAQLGVEPEE